MQGLLHTLSCHALVSVINPLVDLVQPVQGFATEVRVVHLTWHGTGHQYIS
jgi:hypothetical protein